MCQERADVGIEERRRAAASAGSCLDKDGGDGDGPGASSTQSRDGELLLWRAARASRPAASRRGVPIVRCAAEIHGLRRARARAVPQPQPPSAFDGESVVDAEEAAEMDYTRLPAVLDAKLLAHDADSAVRPTRIDVGEVWTRRAQRALLAKPSSCALGADEQKGEKEKAFDLLDALSRSGDLPFDCAALHVVVAVTHCFDASLMDTVVVKVRARVRAS